jgi:DMSO/TMAO reductase YedYZ heme-binding membrane subunit
VSLVIAAISAIVFYQFGDDIAELALRNDLVFLFLGIAIFVLPVVGLLYTAWRDGKKVSLEPTPRERSQAFDGFTAVVFLLLMLAFALGCLFLLVQFVRWSWEFAA